MAKFWNRRITPSRQIPGDIRFLNSPPITKSATNKTSVVILLKLIYSSVTLKTTRNRRITLEIIVACFNF